MLIHYDWRSLASTRCRTLGDLLVRAHHEERDIRLKALPDKIAPLLSHLISLWEVIGSLTQLFDCIKRLLSSVAHYTCVRLISRTLQKVYRVSRN